MRRTPLLAALAALAVTGAFAASAFAANGEPQKRFTKVDQARAQSILLTSADLGPGWLPGPSSGSPSADPRCPGWQPDESDLTETGEADRNFQQVTGAVLSSYAAFYKTAAQARASWDRGVKPGMLTCLGGMLEQLSTGTLSIRTVQKGALPFPRVAPRTAAYRLVVELKAGANVLPVYVDIVFLTDGRVQGALMVMAVRRPFAPALEHRLAGLMAKRMDRAVPTA
jgi:hypothetical protein